ncbi:PREDICTED: intraflagellar transport protein 25 homolog [Priapulus caudatus]|uniref:Intraflagellar transport protein 25 homolog n=1 Tax=Priapulus caudatus TaxID=37621 RepID=A0ABM1E7T1_PRICU|nr:PREDICTED: intraflagellar transport protein 25 homolog [Priapulus caudatus]
MFDVALGSACSDISVSTSFDDAHPPENIIDGKPDTFWATTGLFPQEFVLSFSSPVAISNIHIYTYNLKNIMVMRSTEHEAGAFKMLTKKELERTSGSLQSQLIEVPKATVAQHLRFIIESAYDHFVAVYRVSVDGSQIQE